MRHVVNKEVVCVFSTKTEKELKHGADDVFSVGEIYTVIITAFEILLSKDYFR